MDLKIESMIKLIKIPGNLLISMCLVISTMLLFAEESMGQNANKQQENVDSDSLGDTIKQTPIEHPLEPGKVIDDIVPQPGSIFHVGVPQSYFDWKDKVYDRIGLKFGVSYQMLYQTASEVVSDDSYNQALAHWTGFLTKWTLINQIKMKILSKK